MRSAVLAVTLLGACIGSDSDPIGLSEIAHSVVVCGGSLQAAIDAAPQDSVLELCAGTYRERLVIDGKRLELRGVSGAASTVIDADLAGRALVVRGGASVRVTGLTLREGSTSSTGGGISCSASTLRIRDSVLIANRASGGGGGLAATGCALDVAATRFEGNDGGVAGGGALVTSSSGRIATSVFTRNDGADGGGVAIVDGTVELVDSELVDNLGHHGGGLYLAYDGRVAGNLIADNVSDWIGGGVFFEERAPLFEGNTISGSTSVNDGGGFYIHHGEPTLRDNTITGNFAGDDGGGGKLFECTAILEGNLIEGNEAADSGGGLRVGHLPGLLIDNVIRGNVAEQGGGLDLDNDSSVVIGGEVTGNRADDGGGLAIGLGPWSGALLDGVLIADNVATGAGGGLFAFDNHQPIDLAHLIVRGNRAAQGAGLYVTGTDYAMTSSLVERNVATGTGGGLYLGSGVDADHDFLVVHANSAASASAIYIGTGGISVESSIISQHAGTAVRVTSAPTWRYNDTWPRSFSGMSDPTGASGNLGVDPRFVDPAGGDFRLGSGSPAIDAGDPALQDVDGSRADMGMFGGPDGAALPPPPPPSGPAVLEADAHVASDRPGDNFGDAAALETDGSPLSESYLRFRVSGVGTIASARLRLAVTNGTGDAPSLYAASSGWDEATVTWSTRPARTGGVIADLGAASAGTVVEYDVTALVTGNGVYTFALVPTSSDGFDVSSGEGATPPQLVIIEGEPPTPSGPAATLEADAYVAAASPTRNFGGDALVSADADPQEEAYLRFRVSGVTGPVRARLRLHVVDASSDGPAVYLAGSGWSESTLTWSTRPARTGGPLADLGAASIGQVVELDVSSAITADGVYTFALVPTSGSGFGASSREGGAAPALILEATTSPPGPAATLEADAYVAAVSPTRNFGGDALVSADADPQEEAYLRFRVSGVTGPVRARLRLHVVDASSDGPAVYLAGSGWSESTLTWSTRPARTGGALDDLGAASIGQVVELDVSPAITADGVYTFALVPTSGSGFGASSREGAAPPELLVTTP